MKGEPFTPADARTRIRRIIKDGTVDFSRHALKEMEKDNLTTVDCTNVLRGGWVEPPELRDGTWRYRVRTDHMCVVVAFRAETRIVVVTAWRIKP
jgi:hypothetical protein